MVSILVWLVIFGVIIFLVNQIPMVEWMKTIINCVAVLIVCLWLLDRFGLYHFPMQGLR